MLQLFEGLAMRWHFTLCSQVSHVSTAECLNDSADKVMGFCLRWLGILLGAVSLFSLAHRLFDFATAPVVTSLLPYYRSTIHPLVSVFSEGLARASHAIGLVPPLLSADLVIIYFSLGFILLVLYAGDDLEWRRSGEERITWTSLLGRVAIACFWPVILPVALYYFFDRNRNTLRTWVLAAGKMLASAMFIWSVNACFSTLL
jgi:hypothetical protein